MADPSVVDGNLTSSNLQEDVEQDVGTRNRPAIYETQISSGGQSSSAYPKISSVVPGYRAKDRKIGHRRVAKTGEITYKKKPTHELMTAIQLGIGQSIGRLTAKPERDLLMQDFAVVDSVFFPSEGSNLTPAHHCSDFRFKAYAPLAFRYFRELFQIQPDDFMLSLCNDPLRELSNPGASGSIFYISADDEFIIKTVQHKEAEFLQKLLPGYYMNLNQNPRTTLPKFYGLFCYQCGGKNIRFVVMNNLLPSEVTMHERYDLKGSTYKRKASRKEHSKGNPTLKDLDFIELHPNGLLLDRETHEALIKTLQRDCMVLESFKIMDFSLLVGIHNVDFNRERGEDKRSVAENNADAGEETNKTEGSHALQRAKSVKNRVQHYATALESILSDMDIVDFHDDDDVPIGGIPARNERGDRLYIFVGVIDILQSYRLKKKLEHTMKAIVAEGDTISVHRPSFYGQRFQTFLSTKVFTKIPSSLRHSPSKRRNQKPRAVSQSESEDKVKSRSSSTAERPTSHRVINFQDQGAVGGQDDLHPVDSTPPPTFAEATLEDQHLPQHADHLTPTVTRSRDMQHQHPRLAVGVSSNLMLLSRTQSELSEGIPTYTTSSASVLGDELPRDYAAAFDKTSEGYLIRSSAVFDAITELDEEQSVKERPVNEQPVSEQKVSDQTVSEQNVSEQTVKAQPVTERPVSEEYVDERPVSECPVSEQYADEHYASAVELDSLQTSSEIPW